jgi:glyoxylase-like metal-dependent hydrolase (beta-lactamase superfamily II)
LTGHGNNTWLLDGEDPTLIDAGTGSAEHVRSIASRLGGRPLSRVLVTHGHPDHAAGITALRERWPAVESCKWLLPGEAGWRGLSHGQRVRAGDRQLQVVHTPGHAPDHLCFWDSDNGDLFSGDMVIAGTTVMIPAGHGGNLRQYIQSLETMAALRPRRILPAHGPVIERPLELIADYLEHRRLREGQVRACLAEGISDVGAIVSRLYPDLPDAVRSAARLTIEAHLEKLKEESNG